MISLCLSLTPNTAGYHHLRIMDLPKLAHPLGHTDDQLSGWERAICSGQASSSSSTAAVVEGNSSSGASQKVYVAVGKSVDKSVSLLQWTLRKFGKNAEIFLAHVHQPSPYIPTLLGKLPAGQANREVVASHREEEREKTRKLLQSYRDIFSKTKIKASIITIEAEHIQTGLVDMVIQYRIRKLVMGSESDNCMKVRKSSTKANYAAKNAPAFCEIWFVNKGKHLWTREAFEGISFSSPIRQADPWISDSMKSKSLRFDEHEPLCCSEHFRSNSFNSSTQCSGRDAWIHDGLVHRGDALPHSDLLCSSPNRSATYVAHSSFVRSSCSSSGCASLAERRNYSDSNFKVEEDNLNSLLEEAEMSKHEASVEFLRRKKLEADAIQTTSKVKELESVYEYEANLRRESEDAVRGMMQEQERLLEERLEVMGELQKTMRNVAVLDSRVQEANRRCEEAAGELKLIQASIISLHQEKQKIRRQKMEAERWLERWRSHRQGGGTDHNGFMGFLDDMPEVAEFTLVDLQTATCNFSDNFKLGERGYGTVYKGELLDKTVVIKKLHAHNMHGPLQFQKEVQVLGKLRHPHLVTLIGACPEAWSLVYDYLPNGSLQYRLFPKSNIAPLTWKDRARIISEISSALLFLHSSHPEKIIHGDLKPDNILLDSDLRCKIGEFGICRLVTEDGLHCPSFRRCAEPQGAFPYEDPELRRTGVLSPKSDIYSFGLVVLQLLTGRPPVGLVASARKAVSSGRLASILDLSAGDWPSSVARKLADMGLRFCELISRNRPDLTPILVRELQQLHASEEHPVPSFFLCPILQEIMHDPVVAADGFTYERQALRGWLQNGRETSPMTNLRLDHLHLTPNHTLRLAIQDWLCKS